MSKVKEDLQAAFAGESQARAKYTAFAQKADEEGYPQVARLFRAAAAAETVHAVNHLKAMGGVGSTLENLKAAFGGERYEVDTMYPPFIQDAQNENDRKASATFRWAWEVEKVHADLYNAAIEGLGKPAETFDYYVCPVCGYTHERNAPERCPVCGAPEARFIKVS